MFCLLGPKHQLCDGISRRNFLRASIHPEMVYGRSDRRAAYPVDNAVTPQEVVTTIYHCLGIATDTELTDVLGRPYRLCQGKVIRDVLA